MGLWDDIVRRGTTGEGRKEEGKLIVCTMNREGRGGPLIGIFTAGDNWPEIITAHFVVDTDTDTNDAREWNRFSNVGITWHIKPADPLELQTWRTTYGVWENTIKFLANSGFDKNEEVITNL